MYNGCVSLLCLSYKYGGIWLVQSTEFVAYIEEIVQKVTWY